MEEACLEDAWACLTQANDIPFLTPPLVEELGLLNCNYEHFDDIANRHYQTPVGTELGAHLLLQHLKWPLEVPDCDLTLTKTIHHDRLKKAKEEWTTLSLSSSHFGHYKVGTYSKCINAVHMALSAILFKTGFSYNWWKKGINVMLEKSLGNFQVDKLQITLLFEADFNQLNKHIGWLIMNHMEQYSLVAGKKYCSQHGCSSITQSLNKRLTFDHIHQLKQAAIICSNDAKSCCIHIIHHIATQSMYQCGVKQNHANLYVLYHTMTQAPYPDPI